MICGDNGASSLTRTQLTEVEGDRKEGRKAEDADACSSHREKSEQKSLCVPGAGHWVSRDQEGCFIAKKAEDTTWTQKKKSLMPANNMSPSTPPCPKSEDLDGLGACLRPESLYRHLGFC